MSNLYSNGVLCLFALTLGSSFFDHRYGYIPLGILSLIGFIKMGMVIKDLKIIDFIPILIFSSWLIVFAHGSLSNGILNASQNFPSLPLYMSYYAIFGVVLIRKKIQLLLKYISLIAFIYCLYLFLNALMAGSYILEYYSSISDFRIEYAPFAIFMLYQIFGYLYFLAYTKAKSDRELKSDAFMHFDNKVINIIYVIAALILYIFISMSKAFILSALIVYLISLSAFYFNLSGNRIFIHALLFLTITFSSIVYILFGDIISYSFSVNEISNATRNQQLPMLMDELSFFGAGFGRVLNSGYVRDWDFPTSFELTYINLIHKMGIFAFPVFSLWILTLVRCLKIIFRGSRINLIMAAGGILALHSFVLIGYSNPIPFATNFIALSVLSLYFLRNNSH
jgi:hypothetical protein